ncbi:hypothetical protein, partial [Rhodoferax sp.]|uniref:hypothetical protein n=1 Tax=Rhodoferax sp. TaxID=50421 RepID=UPI00272D63B7
HGTNTSTNHSQTGKESFFHFSNFQKHRKIPVKNSRRFTTLASFRLKSFSGFVNRAALTARTFEFRLKILVFTTGHRIRVDLERLIRTRQTAISTCKFSHFFLLKKPNKPGIKPMGRPHRQRETKDQQTNSQHVQRSHSVHVAA